MPTLLGIIEVFPLPILAALKIGSTIKTRPLIKIFLDVADRDGNSTKWALTIISGVDLGSL